MTLCPLGPIYMCHMAVACLSTDGAHIPTCLLCAFKLVLTYSDPSRVFKYVQYLEDGFTSSISQWVSMPEQGIWTQVPWVPAWLTLPTTQQWQFIYPYIPGTIYSSMNVNNWSKSWKCRLASLSTVLWKHWGLKLTIPTFKEWICGLHRIVNESTAYGSNWAI